MSHFGHVDLRVSDLSVALAFYEELMPAVGFSERYHGDNWKVWATTEPLPSTAYFAITEERNHVSNSNRVAFWVESATEVERIAEVPAGQAPWISAVRSRCLIRPGTTRHSSPIRLAIASRYTSGPSSTFWRRVRRLRQCSRMTPDALRAPAEDLENRVHRRDTLPTAF